MIRRLVLALTLILCAVGCGCGRGSGVTKKYAVPSDVSPWAKYGSKAKLTLGRDTVVNVDVAQNDQGPNLLVDLSAHGQSFEKEIYRRDPNAFFLVGAVGVEYDPPIKLLQFPFDIGDSWTWTGKVINGEHSNNGRAKITTSSDRLLLPSAPTDTILVEVLLQIDNGTQKWAERKLSFWFVPGKGLVRRNFGTSSRDPVQ